MKAWKRKARVDQLKAMHELMISANDEEMYMIWNGIFSLGHNVIR